MKRTTMCRTCGATIRPRAADMSLAAAVRIHYWRRHREVMMAAHAKPTAGRAAAPARSRKRRGG